MDSRTELCTADRAVGPKRWEGRLLSLEETASPQGQPSRKRMAEV